MHYNQVAKRRRRYLRGGIGALQDEPRSGRKSNISTELLRQIVDQATRPPGLTTQIAPSNVVWSIIISGFATTSIFVPMATFSMATLSRENIGEGTGLTNLLRNLGGSVGISAITTLQSRCAQTHQALMVGHLSQYNPVFSGQLAKMQTALTPHVGSSAAHHQAYGLIYQTVQQQASLWSYVDLFRMLVIVCLLSVPLVFLFKKPKHAVVPGELAAAH